MRAAMQTVLWMGVCGLGGCQQDVGDASPTDDSSTTVTGADTTGEPDATTGESEPGPTGTSASVTTSTSGDDSGDGPDSGTSSTGADTADDTGGAITGQHIDFFAATKVCYQALVGPMPDSVKIHQGGARCP